MDHCCLIQGGDLQAIVGDTSRDGAGGPKYCGLWSLTHRDYVFNAFGNSYCGLSSRDQRVGGCTLIQESDTAASLTSKNVGPSKVDMTVRYEVAEPNAIDLTASMNFHSAQGDNNHRAISFYNFMNSPAEPKIRFRSNDRWMSYMSPAHGVGSNIAPAYVREEHLEEMPPQYERGYHEDRLLVGFDEPFFYGRLGPMMFLLIFAQPKWTRFLMSPSGGGPSLIPGRSSPAWSFQWVIPPVAFGPGLDYVFRSRLIYKPFVSDDEVIELARRTQAQLSYNLPPAPIR